MAIISKESLGSPAVAEHTGVSWLHDVERPVQPCYEKVFGKTH